MKAVLISIRPEWCAKIASGEKTIELRKTRPNLDPPFKCYIYCTKSAGFLILRPHRPFGNGKVIGEFVCDRIYPITIEENGPFSEERGGGYNEGYTSDGEHDALTDEQFDRYLSGRPGYGWHISDLVIYNEPLHLSDFLRPMCERVSDCGSCRHWRIETFDCGRGNIIRRPPQSWIYVELLHKKAVPAATGTARK